MTLQRHQFGNFKRPIVERLKAKNRDTHDDRDGNDSNYLAALRKCPCVVTLKMPAGEVHHLKALTGERGMGQRSTDRWGVPLSRIPHDAVERVGSRNEMKWFSEQNLPDPHGLCAALWAQRPKDGSEKSIKISTAAMTKIILAHHNGKTDRPSTHRGSGE